MQSVELAEGVEVLFASITELADMPLDERERTSLGPDAVDKRRREFHAGRALARKAMRRANIAPASIPIGNNRVPKWPSGVRASISHTDSHVAVAVVKSPSIEAVGLDIEAEVDIDPKFESQILSCVERTQCSGNMRSLVEYFCAKEAAYKACYPIYGEYFDMPDVAVRFDGNLFRCSSNIGLASNDALAEGIGCIWSLDGHVISLFYAAAD